MTVNKPNGRMAYGSGGSHPPLNRCERSLSQGHPLPPRPRACCMGVPQKYFPVFHRRFLKGVPNETI